MGVDALLATIAEGAADKPAKADAAPKSIDAGPSDVKPRKGTETLDVMVPTLGESVTEATVSTWFKKVGDTVAQDEMLCELETDKVSVEVPAPAAGVLTEILAAEGSTVQAGGKLAVMTRGEGAAAPAPASLGSGTRRRPLPPRARTSKMRPPPRRPWPKPGFRAMRSPARAATGA